MKKTELLPVTGRSCGLRGERGANVEKYGGRGALAIPVVVLGMFFINLA